MSKRTKIKVEGYLQRNIMEEIPSTLGRDSKRTYYKIKEDTQRELPSRTETKLCIILFPKITFM